MNCAHPNVKLLFLKFASVERKKTEQEKKMGQKEVLKLPAISLDLARQNRPTFTSISIATGFANANRRLVGKCARGRRRTADADGEKALKAGRPSECKSDLKVDAHLLPSLPKIIVKFCGGGPKFIRRGRDILLSISECAAATAAEWEFCSQCCQLSRSKSLMRATLRPT